LQEWETLKAILLLRKPLLSGFVMSAEKVSSVHVRISKNALAVVAALKTKKSLV
jgi:hypothetical protein